ncbi:class I SAM-dependent methyltransferase [Actinobacteria bacterium YIM 96077]|uniref:Methyltransferase n=1 Tax=Phytoactinopolyspora halophila TaxID=1981511 RepID=A0A329R2W5_9ACTN|nr:methyltransferase domain-containing protein [Phytoactinopolyspora halophila]AYY11886.1 class I SAM-dependent methyltransferase [Actinobacteria bacterium YIM 96077]RAW18881.1 methyltransferase [Phytoactinopolyspora halophila]
MLAGRADSGGLSWNYADLARDAVRRATSVLDIDTGGGEMLADLLTGHSAPPNTIATEPYPPNVPRARQRLAGLPVDVRPGTATALPVADDDIDLVLNRHGGLNASEIVRVLAPGGVLLTQQVGSRNDIEFNEALGVSPAIDLEAHTLRSTVAAFESAGFVVDIAYEEFPVTRYRDVGAVVYQLRAVPWQVPGFDIDMFDARLRDIDTHIRRSGGFAVTSHRFLIRAHKATEYQQDVNRTIG